MRLPRSLVCWNVGPRAAGKIVRSLRQIRKDEHPDAFALFEAGRALPAIRRRFGKRWHIFTTADVILLVRKDCERPEVHPFGHQVEWTGPHGGIDHEGREHMAVTWSTGLYWALMHGVPGGPRGGVNEFLRIDGEFYGRNRAAWMADERLLAREVRSHLGPVFVAGDLNATRTELAARWDSLGLKEIPTRAHVDHAAARGLKVAATRLDNYGSDHPAIRYSPKP